MSELWRKLENEKVTLLAINFMQNYGMDKVHTRQNCEVSSYENRGLIFPRTRAVDSYTTSILVIICVKNVGAKVVCGLFMKKLIKHMLKI